MILSILLKFAVPARDVHINKQPNHKQYDGKTDNITLTCKASGDPYPEYKWFKENNNKTIISGTNLYVIENVTRNNSGVYTCEAYNIINSVKYTQSNSMEINIGNYNIDFVLIYTTINTRLRCFRLQEVLFIQ